jgi:hypothetical protein
MKKFLPALSFILLVLPSFALAVYPEVARGAGFAKQSIFLSEQSVTEGDTVRVHATVSNDATATFTGSVVVKDGADTLGTAPVTLAAGAAQAISLSWTPTAGTHTLTADLETVTGTVVEEESAQFTVAAKPQVQSAANSEQQASVDSSQAIQQQIGNLSPQVAQASQPLFTVIDGARASTANLLDNQIANTQAKLLNTPKPGIVAGASVTSDTSVTNPWGTFWFVLYTAYFYILTVLLWLVSNAGIFYPVLAILFLYMLWRLYKRMTRPAWER